MDLFFFGWLLVADPGLSCLQVENLDLFVSYLCDLYNKYIRK